MAVTINDGYELKKGLPNFTRDLFETIAEMVAYKESRLPQMYISSCIEDGNVYVFNKNNVSIDGLGKWRKIGGGGSDFQVKEIPSASESEIGKIYQYIGESSDEFTFGYFYTCKVDETHDEYIQITDETVPIFESDTFYKKVDENNYELLSEQPNDWETNFTDYFRKEIIIDSFKWSRVNVQPSGGGSPTTEKEIIANGNVGNIPDGKSYSANTPIEELVSDLIQGSKLTKNIYVGILDSDVVENLNDFSVVENPNKNFRYSVSASNKFVAVLFESEISDLKDIRDNNNFSNFSDFIKSEIVIEEKNYKLYVSSTRVTCDNFVYTFSF